MAKCQICEITGITTRYCKDCLIILWVIKDILLEPYLQGTIEPEARNFLPELDIFFQRDFKVSRNFNVAWGLLYEFVILEKNQILLGNLPEMKHLAANKRRDVLEILEKAKIVRVEKRTATLMQMKVVPGIVLKKARDVRLADVNFGDEKWIRAGRETKAILTLVIALSLMENQRYVPKNLTRIFMLLVHHVLDNFSQKKIPKKILAGHKKRVLKSIPKWQRLKLVIDLVGFSPQGARIIKDIEPNGTIVLSEVSQGFVELMRLRIREYRRVRGRM